MNMKVFQYSKGDFSNEAYQLEKMLGKNIELLSGYEAVLAGGAITSLFCNREVNDFDLYFPSKYHLAGFIADVMGEGGVLSLSESFQFILIFKTDKSYTFAPKDNTDLKIQCIATGYYPDVGGIFNDFDFTCNMGAYSFKEEKWTLHRDFLKHNAQRIIKFHTGTKYPLVSALRVSKYLDKGYTISRSEYLRIILTCSQLNLSGWGDAKAHVGGMYGTSVEDLFDEEKEFSIDELISQLDTVVNKDMYSKIQDTGIPSLYVEEEVLNLLGEEEEIQKWFEEDEPEIPFKEGLFYKQVKSDWSSLYPMWRSIDYELGAEVDGGSNGIYFLKDPLIPYSPTSHHYVGLRPVGEYQVYDTDCSQRKNRVVGKFSVEERFTYRPLEGRDVFDYISMKLGRE